MKRNSDLCGKQWLWMIYFCDWTPLSAGFALMFKRKCIYYIIIWVKQSVAFRSCFVVIEILIGAVSMHHLMHIDVLQMFLPSKQHLFSYHNFLQPSNSKPTLLHLN